VAVVDYENAAMLQLVLELEALAVVSKPVRSFGILTNLVIARSVRLREEEKAVRIRKLEARLASYRSVDKAKKILMDAQEIDEQTAFRTMRAQAMAKRITLEEMALAIINAHSLLSSRVDET
jgi:AmiR/NasT family two-component response regulator